MMTSVLKMSNADNRNIPSAVHGASTGAGAGEGTTYLDMVGDATAEVERLQIQHRWIQMCIKDRIAFAPVDLKKEGIKVLDMGCADGTVLRDLQKYVPPSAELVGADVSTVFMPTSAQGNIRYMTQDVCDPPADDLKGKFDLTHVRNVLHSTSKSGVEKAVANLVETLAPGGWLQAMEMDISSPQPNQPPALQDVVNVIATMLETTGTPRDYQRRLPDMFRKAGLQNVTVDRIHCGIGKVHSNADDMRMSIEPFRLTTTSVVRQSKVVCPDLPASIVENLVDRYVKDMKETGGFLPALIVYGQKKLDA